MDGRIGVTDETRSGHGPGQAANAGRVACPGCGVAYRIAHPEDVGLVGCGVCGTQFSPHAHSKDGAR
jgi:hypothetical protein